MLRSVLHLHRVLELLGAVGSQRGKESRGGRAQVGAQGERVDPLHFDEAHADQGRQRGREDRAGLHDEGKERSQQDGHVAGQPREVRDLRVDGRLQHLCHSTCWFMRNDFAF